MFIPELKKKNYFRYFQLSASNREINKSTIYFLLLEAELNNVFSNICDPVLKKIKYQWYIEELEKKKSNHSLINNILQIEKQKVYLLTKLSVVYSNFSDQDYVINNWECLFKDVLKIYEEYFDQNYLRTSILFLFCYFIYRNKISFLSTELKNYLQFEYVKNKKSINITERTFLEIFFSKHKKINKIEFLLRYYINTIRYLK